MQRLQPQADAAQQPLNDQELRAQLPSAAKQAASKGSRKASAAQQAPSQARQQLVDPQSEEDEAAKRWARLRGLGDAPESSSDDASSDEDGQPTALAPPSSSEVSLTFQGRIQGDRCWPPDQAHEAAWSSP